LGSEQVHTDLGEKGRLLFSLKILHEDLVTVQGEREDYDYDVLDMSLDDGLPHVVRDALSQHASCCEDGRGDSHR